MTTYYKAVRPDGTDFRTGTVRYDLGAAVTHPAPHRDDASGYLSVSVEPADCTGMKWPCRLLEVEPADPWAPSERLPNKRACHSLRVVRELDPHLALGPQGMHVAALIKRAGTLTPDEAERLGAARDAARAAARYATWNATWDASREAAWDATWDAARAAAQTAALALVVRDLLSREHYRTLTGPWASVIGPAHPDDQEKDNA